MRLRLFEKFRTFHPIAQTVAVLGGAEPVTERMLVRTTWSEAADGMGHGSPVTVVRAATDTMANTSTLLAYTGAEGLKFITLRTRDELPDSNTVLFEGDETEPTAEQRAAAAAALA